MFMWKKAVKIMHALCTRMCVHVCVHCTCVSPGNSEICLYGQFFHITFSMYAHTHTTWEMCLVYGPVIRLCSRIVTVLAWTAVRFLTRALACNSLLP